MIKKTLLSGLIFTALLSFTFSYAESSDRMMINAWFGVEEGKGGVFSFDGICTYPEGTRVEVAVYYDGYLKSTKRVEVKKNETGALHFTDKIVTGKRVLSATYVLKAVFTLDNQPYKVAEKLAGAPPVNSCDFTISVKPEEIEATLQEHIKFVNDQLKQIEDLNKELIDNYNKYIPAGSSGEVPDRGKRVNFDPVKWDDFMRAWTAKLNNLKKDKEAFERGLFVPLFVTISEDIDSLMSLLRIIGNVANDELYGKANSDFTDPLTGQKVERKSFAEWQGQFELALRARHIDLSYKNGKFDANMFVSELTTVKNLYQELINIYNTEITSAKGPEAERWNKAITDWETRRAAIEKNLKKYEGVESFKEMEKGIASFLFLPADLKSLSMEITKALFGTPEDRANINLPDSRKRFEITYANARKALRIQADLMPSETAKLPVETLPTVLTPELKKEIQGLMKIFESGDKQPTIEQFKKMDQNRYRIANDYGPVAIDVLAERLSDKDKYMRENAVTVMGMIQDKKIVPLLCNLIEQNLAKPEFEGSKMYAIEGLKRMGDKTAAPTVIKALSDKSANVKGSAADALAVLGDKNDRNMLFGLIELLDSIPDNAKPGDKNSRALPIIAKRTLETLLNQKLTIDVLKLPKEQLTDIKLRMKEKLE